MCKKSGQNEPIRKTCMEYQDCCPNILGLCPPFRKVGEPWVQRVKTRWAQASCFMNKRCTKIESLLPNLYFYPYLIMLCHLNRWTSLHNKANMMKTLEVEFLCWWFDCRRQLSSSSTYPRPTKSKACEEMTRGKLQACFFKIGATSHTSQEPWPWDCESPEESAQRPSQHTSKIMSCGHGSSSVLWSHVWLRPRPNVVSTNLYSYMCILTHDKV